MIKNVFVFVNIVFKTCYSYTKHACSCNKFKNGLEVDHIAFTIISFRLKFAVHLVKDIEMLLLQFILIKLWGFWVRLYIVLTLFKESNVLSRIGATFHKPFLKRSIEWRWWVSLCWNSLTKISYRWSYYSRNQSLNRFFCCKYESKYCVCFSPPACRYLDIFTKTFLLLKIYARSIELLISFLGVKRYSFMKLVVASQKKYYQRDNQVTKTIRKGLGIYLILHILTRKIKRGLQHLLRCKSNWPNN